MAFLHQTSEVRRASELGVDLRDVLLPVAVKTAVRLERDRGYPYGVGPKALNVVELAYNPLKRPPAVVMQVRTLVLASCEPVREKLQDFAKIYAVK